MGGMHMNRSLWRKAVALTLTAAMTAGPVSYTHLVKEDGTVDFKFSHASDYVIVLNDTDMSQTTGSVIASPKTSDNTPIAAAVILLLFGCALMGTAYRKNKHF